MARYFKCLTAFILVLVPELCLADILQDLSLVPPVTDISISFLAKMFGAVPGSPQLSSAGATVLSVLFNFFNYGVLILASGFLGYTTLKILTDTSSDGTLLGKSTTIWTAVRCSMGAGLLVPQASGYSIINGVVMWVVIQSIGLADLTWNRALDYLEQGGPLYSQTSSLMDYSLITYGVTSGKKEIDDTNLPPNAGAADVLRSLTCAFSVHDALVASQQKKHDFLMKKVKDQGAVLSVDMQQEFVNSSKLIPEMSGVFSLYKHFPSKCSSKDSKGNCIGSYTDGAFQFPYIEDEGQNPLQDYGLNLKPSEIPRDLSGICGTISYLVEKKGQGEDPTYNERSKRYVSAKLQGLENMIAILSPVAKRIAEQTRVDEDTGKVPLDINNYIVAAGDKKLLQDYKRPLDLSSDNQTVSDLQKMSIDNMPAVNWPIGADEILSAAAAYQIALAPAQADGAKASNDSKKTKFAAARGYGWLGAGGYYRLLVAMQEDIKKEYDSYRLKGYRDLNQPFLTNNLLEVRDSVFFTLFAQAFKNNANAVGSPATSLGMIDSQYPDYLNNAMLWIYLSYPYAKLHGRSLYNSKLGIQAPIFDIDPQYGSTKNVSNVSTLMKALVGVGLIDSSDTDQEDARKKLEMRIYAQQISGAIFLATLPPLAIPRLLPVPMMWLQFDVDAIFYAWNDIMVLGSQAQTLDPVMKLQNLGDVMVESGISFIEHIRSLFLTIATTLTVASIALTVLGWAASSGSTMAASLGVSGALDVMLTLYNGLIDVSQKIVFMDLPIVIGVLGPILVSGIMFSIYVPLIPYLLFMFGAISWLISVLVLMAAAPIICFLMFWSSASNENPLLAREAEQFILQIVAIFFRPTLMVIGLITGMVLSYIGVDLLNLGFADAINGIIQSSSDSQLKLIKQVGVVSVYTFVMLSIVNMCFSAIYLLYSEVMRVVGVSVPVMGVEEKQIEAVKGEVTQVAESVEAGIKEAAISAKEAGMRFTGLSGEDNNNDDDDDKKEDDDENKEEQEKQIRGKNEDGLQRSSSQQQPTGPSSDQSQIPSSSQQQQTGPSSDQSQIPSSSQQQQTGSSSGSGKGVGQQGSQAVGQGVRQDAVGGTVPKGGTTGVGGGTAAG